VRLEEAIRPTPAKVSMTVHLGPMEAGMLSTVSVSLFAESRRLTHLVG